jgi:hypothetical protein
MRWTNHFTLVVHSKWNLFSLKSHNLSWQTPMNKHLYFSSFLFCSLYKLIEPIGGFSILMHDESTVWLIFCLAWSHNSLAHENNKKYFERYLLKVANDANFFKVWPTFPSPIVFKMNINRKAKWEAATISQLVMFCFRPIEF